MDQTGRDRRYLFALGCLSMFLIATAGQILPAALGPISNEFHRNLAQSGILLLLGPVGFILSTLVSGYLSDRWGQRPFILLGGALIAAGLGMIAFATTYSALLGGLFLIGLSGGFLESPVSAVVADAFPEHRAQVLNLTQIFYNVGAVVGPALLAGVLAFGWGWRSGFGLCIVLAVVSVILGYRGLPKHRVSVEGGDSPGGVAPVRWGLVSAISLALFLYVGGEMTIAQWSAKYVQDTFGVVASRAALTVSGFWLGMGMGRALYIPVVARFGYLPPLLASSLLGAACAFLAASAGDGAWAGTACALSGFCLGGSWPTLLGYASYCNPGRTGTVFGVIVSAGAAGAAVVPPLGGWVAQHSASRIRATMVLGGCVVLLEGAVILLLMAAERRRQKAQLRG